MELTCYHVVLHDLVMFFISELYEDVKYVDSVWKALVIT